jgi:Uma2 family endonuclease
MSLFVNAEKMRDRKRIDMTVDPPPDLAIEADVTSKTALDIYIIYWLVPPVSTKLSEYLVLKPLLK